MSEELIVRNCSPTLAGIKTGNIFSCSFGSKQELTDYLRRVNQRLVPKGLRMIPIRVSQNRALLYLYRPALLRRDFSDAEVQDILGQYGYAFEKPERCVMKLIERLRERDEFPHEIGLFLGYPAEDVKGFIENKAESCKCVGCWKVYGDKERAQKTFAQYKKCTKAYCDLWERGKPIERLAIG